MCVTYIRPFGENRWVEYHRTEVISNSHDPDFAAKILLAYRFEEQQPLRFEIYDVDSSSPNLLDHDFLGAVSCNLGQIIGSGKVRSLKIFSSITSLIRYILYSCFFFFFLLYR